MTYRSVLRGEWRLALLLSALVGMHGINAETLPEAWALAETHDSGLEAARSEAEAGQFEAQAARGERWPALMATGTFNQFQDGPAFSFGAAGLPARLPDIFSHDNFVMAGVSVNVPLYTGGRISSQIAAAEAGSTARAAAAERTQKDLRLAVAESYVAVLRAERALAVAQSNVASLAEYLSDVQSMFNREAVPRNDLLSAQVALANAEQGRLQAANGVKLARAAYNRRIGQPLDRSFELASVTSIAGVDLAGNQLAELEEKAQAARAEIAVLEAHGRALGYAAQAEHSQLRPQVSLMGGYQYLENDALDREEFLMAGIGLKWMLFDGGQIRNRSASLRRSQLAMEQRLVELRSMLALEVRQAWYNLQESRARIEVARGAVEQSEENLRIATQQYGAGLVNSTRVLEAEALRTLSRSNGENALLDAELAHIRLARAVGEL